MVSIVIDARLSQAVVVYIYGGPQGRMFPSSSAEAVAEAFGDDALDLLPRIYAITSVVEAISEAEWWTFPGSLSEMANRIETEIRNINPELDDDAIRAVGNWWAFNHR